MEALSNLPELERRVIEQSAVGVTYGMYVVLYVCFCVCVSVCLALAYKKKQSQLSVCLLCNCEVAYDATHSMRVHGSHPFNTTETKIITDRPYVPSRLIIENLFYLLVHCMCIVINFNYFEQHVD